MTVFGGDIPMEAEDKPTDSYGAGYADVLANAVSHSLFSGVGDLAHVGEYQRAKGGDFTLAGQVGRLQERIGAGATPDEAAAVTAQESQTRTLAPDVANQLPMAQAQQQVKEAGLDKAMKLPDQPVIRQQTLDLMMKDARDRAQYESVLNRGPTGGGALDFGTSLAVGMLDPFNIALGMVPVVGEARYAKLMESAGTSILRRAAVRGGVGVAQGAAFSGAGVPLNAWLASEEGRDYTMSDALREVIQGGATFGLMHVVGGTGADIYRRARGRPVYPFGPGEPMENVQGTHVPAALLAEEGVPAETVAAHLGPQPPAIDDVMLGDLPYQAKEDLMRGAIGQMVEGKEVVAGQQLVAGAEVDPRLDAAGFEAFHGSPHDFERFQASRIGTGEGAQAYGHGLYFAQEEAVAHDYAGRYLDRAIDMADPHQVAALYLDQAGGDRARAAGDLDAYLRNPFPGLKANELEGIREASRLLATGALIAKSAPKGTLYRVRINAEQDHFLDWDKPLAEQSEYIQSILRKAGFKDEQTGREIYQSLIKHRPDDGGAMNSAGMRLSDLDKTPENASGRMRVSGIRGIRYLDQGSRAGIPKMDTMLAVAKAQDELAATTDPARRKELEAELAAHEESLKQTRNFVVFDDKDIEITHKNGEPVKREELAPAVHVTEPAKRGPRARPEETWSLLEFLASRGGLKADDPLASDVRQSFGGKNRFVPGFGPLVRKNGMTLDRAREAAVEAGYLHDEGDRTGGLAQSTINDLLEAIDREARGERVYRPGQERSAQVGIDRDEELHRMGQAIDGALEDSGIDPKTINSATRDRMLELMDKEHVTDPLVALERAVMEETYNGASRGEAENLPEHIPGWDVPDVAGSAQAGSGGAPGVAQPGAAEAGGPARPVGAGDRGAELRRLAERPGPADDPDAIAAFNKAQALPEPAPAGSPKASQAAEKAAAEAEAAWADVANYLTPEERRRFDDAFAASEQASADRLETLRRGGACLMMAAGG